VLLLAPPIETYFPPFSPPTGSPSWTPGDEELEQAALAVSLLARLPGALRSHDALLAAGASAAATGSLSGLRDDMWQLWQALAGHDKGAGALSGILVRSAWGEHVNRTVAKAFTPSCQVSMRCVRFPVLLLLLPAHAPVLCPCV
jgi:hypothetical protein